MPAYQIQSNVNEMGDLCTIYVIFDLSRIEIYITILQYICIFRMFVFLNTAVCTYHKSVINLEKLKRTERTSMINKTKGNIHISCSFTYCIKVCMSSMNLDSFFLHL